MRPARAALALGVLALLAAGAAQGTDDSGSRGQKMYGDPCTTEEDCLLMNSICDPVLKQCVCDPSTPATNHFDKCGKDSGSRGQKMYGDPCTTEEDCLLMNSICDPVLKQCVCDPSTPATNHFDKCGKALNINESCTFNEQCSETTLKTECRNGRCTCIYELVPVKTAEGYSCIGETYVEESIRTFDPAMIGVLVGMALMFIIICVVLRLFSKARWSENRTIFNTPNPRLMNVSLLRESKLDRRGSRISMRPPSRQASQQDLRPHSPGSRRGSKASSGHSASSVRSATLRSPTMTCPTSVTVEIRAPE